MLHSLLLGLVRDDGTLHGIGRTGGGFSDEQRGTMLKDMVKRIALSTLIEVNSDRVVYKMLKPGLVAKISCLDCHQVTTLQPSAVFVEISEGRSAVRDKGAPILGECCQLAVVAGGVAGLDIDRAVKGCAVDLFQAAPEGLPFEPEFERTRHEAAPEHLCPRARQ